MHKLQSYTIVHYGKDYIGFALKSIVDVIPKINVFYTETPSHGHPTNERCPETAQDILNAIEEQIPLNRFNFVRSPRIAHEGQQRDWAVNHCVRQGAETLLVIDCDEVWHADVLEKAIKHVIDGNQRSWLINFTHLWRSFDWACRDESCPVRFLDTTCNDGNGYIPKELGNIYHFGYAIRDSLMRYKWQIHGHHNELRSGWFDTKWSVWPPPEDCHPTNDQNFWTPQKFDKTTLPPVMLKHPFYYNERIE